MRRLTVAVTDALSGKITYRYDAGDRLVQIVGAGGAVTSHSYDSLGQRVETFDPDSGRWQYVYDPFGRLVKQIDAKRQVTTVEIRFARATGAQGAERRRELVEVRQGVTRDRNGRVDHRR
jgi:YD repeat-containing protein